MSAVDVNRPPQRLSALLAGIAPVSPQQDVEVTGIDTDSRRLRVGELFMACRSFGGGRHGIAYAEQARARGAAAMLWEPMPDQAAPDVALPGIAVAELSRHAGWLAARFYGEPSAQLFVVGITGTDGKTSTAHILAQALDRLGGHCGYLGTLGYGFLPQLDASTHTTPDVVMLQRWLAWLAQEGADSVMMEVSSHALDQSRVNGVEFDLAVLITTAITHITLRPSDACLTSPACVPPSSIRTTATAASGSVNCQPGSLALPMVLAPTRCRGLRVSYWVPSLSCMHRACAWPCTPVRAMACWKAGCWAGSMPTTCWPRLRYCWKKVFRWRMH
jgi:hypothetical protein